MFNSVLVGFLGQVDLKQYRAYAGGVVIIFKRPALIIVDHVLKDVRHFECMNSG